MKSFLIGLCFVFVLLGVSKTNEIEKLEININTINSASIFYYFTFADTIDENKTFETISEYDVSLIRATDGIEVEKTKAVIGTRKKGLTIKIDLVNSSKEDVEKIFSKNLPAYLSVNRSIKIFMPEGEDPFYISPDKIKSLTLSTKTLTDAQKELLINGIDENAFVLRNNIDFSKEVNNPDSSKSEYLMSFDIQKPFLTNLLKAPIYYKLKGRLSTNENNPLNTIEAYLKYNVADNIHFEAGRIGPQNFKRNMLRANFAVETLIPNLIDLTNGETRLRLKPYLKLGFGYQQNFQKDNPFGNKEGNLILLAEGYYNIPILDKYVLIAEAEATYSDKFAVSRDVLFNYSITFGYQTPAENLQVLFKVVNGENAINVGNSTVYSIGLLLDFLPID